MPIRKHIREYRAEHGLTQAGLAEKWGVSVKTISRWERGHRPAQWLSSVHETMPKAPEVVRRDVTVIEGYKVLVETSKRSAMLFVDEVCIARSLRAYELCNEGRGEPVEIIGKHYSEIAPVDLTNLIADANVQRVAPESSLSSILGRFLGESPVGTCPMRFELYVVRDASGAPVCTFTFNDVVTEDEYAALPDFRFRL